MAALAYFQTLIDGLYDVVTPVKVKKRRSISADSSGSPLPVQLTIFDILRDWAKEQLAKIDSDYWSVVGHTPEESKQFVQDYRWFAFVWGL